MIIHRMNITEAAQLPRSSDAFTVQSRLVNAHERLQTNGQWTALQMRRFIWGHLIKPEIWQSAIYIRLESVGDLPNRNAPTR